MVLPKNCRTPLLSAGILPVSFIRQIVSNCCSSDFFVEDFGGQKVRVDIPESSFDELTGAALNFEQVKQGMKTEVQQLERLKAGAVLSNVTAGH